jgi:L-asparaginase II
MDSSRFAAKASTNGYRPLVKVWRGDTVESLHHGVVVVMDDAGREVARHGDPSLVTYLRSSAKPAQVLPLLASGAAERFGFSDAEIAVMIGSHGGEPFHVEAVRAILERIGVGEEALQCGAHPPYHRPSAQALRAAHEEPTAVHNNCSGKHAGMLALAVHLGAPTAGYLDEGHPVQRRILAAVAALAGLAPGDIRTAIDGCSAPNFALSMSAAATMYARLIAPGGLPADLQAAARRVVAAMRRHPEMVAGTDRLCTALMRSASGGLIAKIGAEGFYGLGFERDGRGLGVALKVADGDGDRAGLQERYVGPLRNHRGLVVGRVDACLDLHPAR